MVTFVIADVYNLQVQGLGTNPVNQLSKKWGLQVAVNDGADVVFYDNHGKVNGTKTYNDFNDALDATYNLARMYKMSYRTKLEGTFTKKIIWKIVLHC